MSEKKLKQSAHVLETEDLLELLESEEAIQEGPIDYENDVLNFISTFTIEPGQEKIKQHTLYLIYKVWSKNPIKKAEFQNKMTNYFENCKLGNSSAYYINQNAIKLTHSAYKYFTNKNIRVNSKTRAKHFEDFLKFHSLTKGDYWIHEDILYFIYDKYCHATGLDKHYNQSLSENRFKIYCKIYLPQKVTKHGKMLAVSDNIKQFFQIGQLKRMEDEYAQEKKPKKRRRAPRSKS